VQFKWQTLYFLQTKNYSVEAFFPITFHYWQYSAIISINNPSISFRKIHDMISNRNGKIVSFYAKHAISSAAIWKIKIIWVAISALSRKTMITKANRYFDMYFTFF